MDNKVISIGLEGMRGYIFTAEANVHATHDTLHQAESLYVRGQKNAKRILEILILWATGMCEVELANKFHTIYPDLDEKAMLENDTIYELAMEQASVSTQLPYYHSH